MIPFKVKTRLPLLSLLIACTPLSAALLEDVLLVEGQFQEGFTGGSHINQSTAYSDGQVTLGEAHIGLSFPATVGWINPAPSEGESGSAVEALVTQGLTHLDEVENVYGLYYQGDDLATPDSIYLAYDFIIYNDTTQQIEYNDVGGYKLPTDGTFSPLAVFDQSAAYLAQQSLLTAVRMNPLYTVTRDGSEVELANLILDVPYYEGVSHIMTGNLSLERAFSLRFLSGMQTAAPPIKDELAELGWDLTTDSFSQIGGAWYHFTEASKVWISLLRSPLQREMLVQHASLRTLDYSDHTAFANEADTLVYEGYKDVAAIYKSMAQRAKVLHEVSQRLILLLDRQQASDLVEEHVQQLALEEAFITELFFANGFPVDHEAKYPSLASSVLELRDYISNSSQLRLAALNPDLNALGFDDDVTFVRGADAGLTAYKSTYDWFANEALSTPSGTPAGLLATSMSSDSSAEQTRISFEHKAGNYMQEFENIDNQYDNQLKAITGSLGNNEPNLAAPETGGGLLQQQIDNIAMAKNNINRIVAQMTNLEAWIDIERDTQQRLGVISDKRVRLINSVGNQVGDLEWRISEVREDMESAQSLTNALVSSSSNPFGAGVAYSATAANAVAQSAGNRKLRKLQRRITHLQTEKEAQFEFWNNETGSINSAAAIKRKFLEMRVLDIDLLNAEIRLNQENNRLVQYYQQIDDFINQKQLASVRLAQRSFADPTFRIEVTQAALQAEQKYDELQNWFYLMFKSLDYKWPISGVGENSSLNLLKQNVLQARTAEELNLLVDEMKSYDSAKSTNTNDTDTYYASFSIAEDGMGITGTQQQSDGSTVTSQQQLTQELDRLLNDPRYRVTIGNAEYFSIPFSTVRFDHQNDSSTVITTKVDQVSGNELQEVTVQATPSPIFGNGLWDSKIEWVQVSLAGNNLYSDDPLQMPGRLMYGGSTFLRTKDYYCVADTEAGTNVAVDYRQYPPMTYDYTPTAGGLTWTASNHLEAQVTTLITRDAPSNIPEDVYRTNNFKELPLAATDWRLLLPIDGLNLANIRDININFVYSGRTTPSGRNDTCP